MRNHWIQISESSPKRYLPGQRGGGKVRLTQCCHHQNDFCIETGSDESHYVPLIVRSRVTKPCPQTTTFEEGGEPKRNWTEVHLSAHYPYSVRPEPAHTMPLSASSVLLYVHRDRTLSLCIQPNLLTVKLKTEIPSPPLTMSEAIYAKQAAACKLFYAVRVSAATTSACATRSLFRYAFDSAMLSFSRYNAWYRN